MPVLAALLISAAGCQNSCSQSAAGTRGPRRGGLQGPPCPRRVRSAWRGACGSAGVLGLGDGSVNTPSGLLRETCVRRRPGPVAGLPAAEPGVRYLMSRITALAVRDRPLTGEWRTGLLFVLATVLLSAWLGLLPGTVDNTLRNGRAGGGQVWTSWLIVVLLVLGVVTFVTRPHVPAPPSLWRGACGTTGRCARGSTV